MATYDEVQRAVREARHDLQFLTTDTPVKEAQLHGWLEPILDALDTLLTGVSYTPETQLELRDVLSDLDLDLVIDAIERDSHGQS